MNAAPRHPSEANDIRQLSTRHLNQNQLAERWGISPRTLEHWRSAGKGPRFLRLGTRVAYRLEDVEDFESANLIGRTTDLAMKQGGGC
jgi:predicted DNA-binding transcriptional regulator AlpA